MTDGTTVCFIVSLISIFVGNIVCMELSGQYSFCEYDNWYGLERASCTGRHLYSIHTGASNTVKALDLSDNVISILYSYELARLGLTKLKYLNLTENAISDIGLNAFYGLIDLTVLDLSKNRLHDVFHDTFEGNKNLRILKLSKNNFNSNVPKLRASGLTELYLDSCQITHLPPDTFDGLTHIHRLDLSNNLMIQMSNTIVQALHFLKTLSLEGNPWSCNRIMYELQVYLKIRNIEFDGICDKKTSPKKFEKMIIMPNWKRPNYHRPAIANMSADDAVSTIKYNSSNTSNNKKLSNCEQTLNQTDIINSVNQNLPYWFLCIGIIFGISCGMVISYFWLSGYISCNRRCRRREPFEEISQSYIVLNPFIQGQIDNDASSIESCPGTPPPPYREVMLRPSQYRCPSIVRNLNNNGTGYRERYT